MFCLKTEKQALKAPRLKGRWYAAPRMKKIITLQIQDPTSFVGAAADDRQFLLVKYHAARNALRIRHVIAGRVFEQEHVPLGYLLDLCASSDHPSFAALAEKLTVFDHLPELRTPVPFHVETFESEWPEEERRKVA